MMLGLVLAGSTVKSGSSESATFIRKVPDPVLKRPCIRLLNSAGMSAGVEQPPVEQRGPTLAATIGRDLLAALQPHARGLAAIDQHACDRRLQADLDAGVFAGLAP
jgi:hypothetical protein